MREDYSDNNLFFVCSLIEYIARKTKNTKKYIIEKLGEKNINKIYTLADIYHSENIEKITEEIIKDSKIEIGRVYQRLIIMISTNKDKYIDNLITVLTSWIIPKIDNYNSSLYYENPDYIYACYIENKIL